MNMVNAWVYGMAVPIQSCLVTPGMLLAIVVWFGGFVVVAALASSLHWRAGIEGRTVAVVLGVTTLIAHLWALAPLLHDPSMPAGVSPLVAAVAGDLGRRAAIAYGIAWAMLWAAGSSASYLFYRVNRPGLFLDEEVSFRTFVRRVGGPATGVILNRPRQLLIAFCLSTLGPFWLYVALLDATQVSVVGAYLPAVPLVLLLWLSSASIVFLAVTYRANMRFLGARRERPRLFLVYGATSPLAGSPGTTSLPLTCHTAPEDDPWPPAAA